MRMFDPERIVGDRLDLARRLQYPAFAPGIDDAMVAGPVGQERQWQFEDDRIAVLARPRVLAGVNKPEIDVFVLFEAIAFPRQRSRRQLPLDAVTPIGLARIIVEQVVAFELEKCLRNLELPHIGHRVGDVIELRGIVDRPEKAGQIIEERVVPAADKDFDRLAVWRLQYDALSRTENCCEASARVIEETVFSL